MTTPIRLTLRPGDGPASAQVREAIRRSIERGTLAPGDRLTPVRAAAVDLGLAPNTVARAYRELETGGWLIGRGRAGTFVADAPPAPQDPRAALDAAARRYLRRAAALGFSRADARQALEDAR